MIQQLSDIVNTTIQCLTIDIHQQKMQ